MNSNLYDEYAKWTDTVAKYPPTAEPFYLALGIADECGELEGCDRSQDIKEAGDVLWYAARYATRVLKVPFAVAVEDARNVQRTSASYSFIVNAGIICGVEKKRIRDGHLWDDATKHHKEVAARDALARIIHSVIVILASSGATIDDAIMINMGKLNARLEAGTIQGDGDHR